MTFEALGEFLVAHKAAQAARPPKPAAAPRRRA
jgi:hypothetical protein